jgi:hypothetical protein
VTWRTITEMGSDVGEFNVLLLSMVLVQLPP